MVPDLGWCLHREVVYLGFEDEMPVTTELRFYNVSTLLEGYGDLDDIMTLVQEVSYSSYEEWNRSGVFLDSWRDMLAINHTAEMHERVEHSLNRMLSRSNDVETETPRWKTELAESLERIVSLRAEGNPQFVTAGLGQEYGLPIVFPPDLAEEYEVSLELTDVTLLSALEWIADQCEVYVGYEDGAVVFDRWAPLEYRFFSIGDLVPDEDSDDGLDRRAVDGLETLIREYVDVESWDERPEIFITLWRDMFVVRQTRSALDGTERLIDAARRASRR